MDNSKIYKIENCYQLAQEILNVMDSEFWKNIPKKAFESLSSVEKLLKEIKLNDTDKIVIRKISDKLISATHLYPTFHAMYTSKSIKEEESHVLVCKMIDLCETFLENKKDDYINRIRKPGYSTLNEFLPNGTGDFDSRDD